MLRYLAPELLDERGVEHFDAWAANFAEAVTALELAPDGSGYRMHTRFAKFINLPELLSMFRTFADVQTADMLNLPRPALEGGRPQIAAAPASPEAQGLYPDAHRTRRRLRTSARRSARRQHAEDHRRRPQGRARHAPGRSFRRAGADTKLERAVAGSSAIWKATQSATLDAARLLRPLDAGPGRFNVYDEVREADRGGRARTAKSPLSMTPTRDADKKTAVRRGERRAGPHPPRLHREDGRRDERAAAARRAASSRRAVAAARYRAARRPDPAAGQSRTTRFRSTATSPKARSTPICGRRWKPRPASSSR